ncbi:DUF5615 family PIN-like protein [bacterium]|nr:DUF5615 family PIN-like protein [bacterium]
MIGSSDREQLAFATKNNRVIITRDHDFLRLDSQGIKHCGIVYANPKTSIGELIRGIMLIATILDPDSMNNHIEFI